MGTVLFNMHALLLFTITGKNAPCNFTLIYLKLNTKIVIVIFGNF
jgi:hypothetical protein